MQAKIDISNVLKAIDKELNEAQSGRIQNKAINKGAEVVANDLTSAFDKFVGTKHSKGATRDEITVQKARSVQGERRATIGWSGHKERYRLIHLNEWGYTRNGKKYRPRMMGTVEGTLEKSNDKYYDAVYKEMKNHYAR